MKKLFTLSALLFMVHLLFAQAPLTFNYQGVARNAAGTPYSNKEITVRLTVRNGTASGNAEYGETRVVTTNNFGLFTIQVGSPGVIAVLGTPGTINWSSGKKFLQTEIKLPDQNAFVELGTTAIMSVPYAINSLSANQIKLPFDTTVNEYSLTNNAFRIRIKGGPNSRAILGESDNGYGLMGISAKNHGVYGYSEAPQKAGLFGATLTTSGYGVKGETVAATGVLGEATGSGTGVNAKNNHPTGLALSVEGKMRIAGTGQSPAEGKVLTSDAAGNASWQYPKTVAFRASGLFNNVNQSIPWATYKKVLFNQSARYNEGNAYDAANSIFFPPVTGIYHLNTQVTWKDETTSVRLRVRLLRNGQLSDLAEDSDVNDAGYYFTLKTSFDIRLQQNDAVWVEVVQNNDGDKDRAISNEGHRTWFTGHLITRL